MSSTSTNGRIILLSLLLFVGTIALYAPSLRNQFVYDDNQLIRGVARPDSLGDIAKTFREGHWHGLPYYRPVARSTMVAQHYLHGDRPGPFHGFNAMLAGVAAVLVYTLLRQPVFMIDRWPAFLGAAIFAAHPVMSSCVYPICSGRETLLPTIFTIAAVIAFVQPGRFWYMLSLLMLALALFSKEQAIIVPGLFVLADLFGISADAPRQNKAAWLRRYGPVLFLCVAYLGIRAAVLGNTYEYHLAIFTHPLRPLLSLVFAAQSTFIPFWQLGYEPRAPIWFSWWRLLITAAAVTGIGVAAWRSRGASGHRTLFWLGWCFLALLPTANLLKQEAHYAERYVLLALIGFVALVAQFSMLALSKTSMTRYVVAAGLLTVAVLAAITLNRCQFFANDSAFLTHWVAIDPQSAPPYVYLAQSYQGTGDLEKAWKYANHAKRVNPHLAEPHNILGELLSVKGEHAASIDKYRDAIRIRPNYAEAHFNLAVALQRRGETSSAIEHLQKAIRHYPGFASAHSKLGLALQERGRLEEAVKHCSIAISLTPSDADAHNNLGSALQAMGHFQQSVDCFKEALRLRPDFSAAHNNFGNALESLHRIDEAIEHYEHALRIEPTNYRAHNNLGVALANQGQYEEALTSFEQALKIYPDFREAMHNRDRAKALLDQRNE